MAEQINRGRLDGVAARGCLADEAAATCPPTTRPDQMRAMLGAALVRLGGYIQGTTRPADPPANPAVLPAP
jgi:hypothetical protein